jgi:hypothetical protein
MRSSVQLAAIVVAALCAGCTTFVEVSYDEADDFSQYRTWDWLPRGTSVDALPGEEEGLESLTGQVVASELEKHGLARDRQRPDLLIGYQLQVQRKIVVVNETGARGFLSSHSNTSPSYSYQTTTSRVEVWDHGYLRFMMTDGAQEKMIWRGEIWARRRGDFAGHLAGAVSKLLDRLPLGDSAIPPTAAAASQ